jgi:hypothetical protein
LNGRFGEKRCAAEISALHLQANAASATCPNTNVGKVRNPDLDVDRSERLLSAS